MRRYTPQMTDKNLDEFAIANIEKYREFMRSRKKSILRRKKKHAD